MCVGRRDRQRQPQSRMYRLHAEDACAVGRAENAAGLGDALIDVRPLAAAGWARGEEWRACQSPAIRSCVRYLGEHGQAVGWDASQIVGH